MKVTSKGQVTIPQEMRERFGIQPGSEVEFVERDNFLVLEPCQKVSDRARAIVERMKGSATIKMTTDEIMALTRGE